MNHFYHKNDFSLSMFLYHFRTQEINSDKLISDHEVDKFINDIENFIYGFMSVDIDESDIDESNDLEPEIQEFVDDIDEWNDSILDDYEEEE